MADFFSHVHSISFPPFLLCLKVQREHHLPAGDFPNVDHFREILSGYNFDKLEKLKPKMIQAVDDMLGYDIPNLLKRFRNPYD
jgi:EH domain-containing protein 1